MSARQDTRITTTLSVVVTTDETSSVCLTKNISQGGALIRSELPLSAGDGIKLDIVRRADHIALQARVSSVNAAGIGIAFENLDHTTQEQMRVLMSELQVGAASGKGEVSTAPVRFAAQWAWWDDYAAQSSWDDAASRTDPLVSLSHDGGAFVTEHRPAVGEVIAVRLTYPEDSTSQAEVVRLTDDGFAVRWHHSPPAFQRGLGLVLTGAHHFHPPPPANP